MPKIYILPNLFTAGSMFCGMMAMFEIFDHGDTVRAIYFIFASAVIDAMDGAVARLTRSQSAFGMYFDSLADVVAFGVAPAWIVYPSLAEEFPQVARATCSLYAVCGAMRLARFNAQSARDPKKTFSGLPIPGAACTLLSIYWFLYLHPSPVEIFFAERVLPLALVVLAALMVSSFPYYGAKSLSLRKRMPLHTLGTIIAIPFLLIVLNQHLEIVAAAVMVPYALSGPVYYLYTRAMHPERLVSGKAAKARVGQPIREAEPGETAPAESTPTDSAAR